MTEEEEFEFRARLENEQKPSLLEKLRTFAPFATLGVGGGLVKAGEALERGAYKTGGAVTDVAAKVLPPEAAAAAGFATNVAIQALPSIVLGEAAKRVAAPALEHGARQLMQSALKPTKDELLKGKAARAINTMFEEGINVTPGGVIKLRSQIDALNREIMADIMSSTATVNKAEVARSLISSLNKFKMQVNPRSDLATIERGWLEFLEHPLLQGRVDIPVQLAQKMKQGTYHAIGGKAYGELKGAEIEVQKTLARGLKEEIAKAVPGIDKLNKAESELLNAEVMVTARVLMDANKNPMSLGWLAAHPSTWMGFAADRSPLVKSLLSRGLHGGAEQIPATAGRAIGAGIGSLLNESQ